MVPEARSQPPTRRADETVLYNVVAEQLETALTRARDRGRGRGRPAPRFVEREFRRFLKCGIFANRFLRVHCVGVLFLVLPLAARTGVGLVGAMGYFLLVACGLITVSLLALYPVASWFGGVSMPQFARACVKPQAVGFSTRSSLASLPAMLEAAEKELELDTKVSGIVLPVATAAFKYASPIARITGTIFVAHLYGVELGPLEITVIAAAIAALSFYSPGVPSGGLFVMTPVYVALQLPVEGIGLLIALDLIPDMFTTTANVTADMVVAVVLGGSEQHSAEEPAG